MTLENETGNDDEGDGVACGPRLAKPGLAVGVLSDDGAFPGEQDDGPEADELHQFSDVAEGFAGDVARVVRGVGLEEAVPVQRLVEETKPATGRLSDEGQGVCYTDGADEDGEGGVEAKADR